MGGWWSSRTWVTAGCCTIKREPAAAVPDNEGGQGVNDQGEVCVPHMTEGWEEKVFNVNDDNYGRDSRVGTAATAVARNRFETEKSMT